MQKINEELHEINEKSRKMNVAADRRLEEMRGGLDAQGACELVDGGPVQRVSRQATPCSIEKSQHLQRT